MQRTLELVPHMMLSRAGALGTGATSSIGQAVQYLILLLRWIAEFLFIQRGWQDENNQWHSTFLYAMDAQLVSMSNMPL